MTRKLLITGARMRENGAKLGEGKLYDSARLLEYNPDTSQTKLLLSIDTPNEHYPDELPNLQFTAGTLDGDTLYLCTDTEIFIYSYPEMNCLKSASYPVFQNIHHIAPHNNYVVVSSTGLDSVVYLDKESLEIIDIISVLKPGMANNPPWHKFSKDVDYRKVHSTKPHQAHPNFTFLLDGNIWSTRFNFMDAVNLSNKEELIPLGDSINAATRHDKTTIGKYGHYGVHDGYNYEGNIYFTTVNGMIVVVSQALRKVIDIIDLNLIDAIGMPLGWCRGLHIENDIAYVGFSRLRDTKIRENVAWVKEFVRGTTHLLRTRVAMYNLNTRQKVGEYLLPKGEIDAIYSILLSDN